MSRFLLRRRDSRGGQTLVEFALILPILVLIMVGLFDAGRAVYALSTVNNAAREAVRLAIIDQNCNRIGQLGQKHASSLDVDWTWDPSLPEDQACLSTGSDVHIQFLQPDYSGDGVTNDCDAGADLSNPDHGPRRTCVAEVTVEYHYTAATPIIGNLMGPLTLTGVTRQPIEATCNSADAGVQRCE